MGVELYQHWLSAAFLFLLMFAEQFYRQPLYDYSLTIIASWQKHGRTSFAEALFNCMADLSSSDFHALVILCAFVVSTRRFFLKLCLVYFCATTVYYSLYVAYRSPRPYFSSDDVQALSCINAYGNPSGHATVSLSVYGFLWISLLRHEGTVFPQSGWKRTPLVWGSLCALIGFVGCVLASRMYFGVHALNQLIFGATLGLWLAYFVAVVLDRYLDEHITAEFYSPRAVHPFWTQTRILAFGFILALQIAMSILYLTDVSNSRAFLDPTWTPRMVSKCHRSPNLISHSLKGIIHTTLYPAIYLSQLVSARCFPLVFRGWTHYLSLCQIIVRTVLAMVVLGVFMAPYTLMKHEALWIFLVFGSLLSNILVSLLGLPLLDWTCDKLGLVNTARTETRPGDEEEKQPMVTGEER